MYKMHKFLKNLLWKWRFTIIIAVVTSLLSSLVMLVVGTLNILMSVTQLVADVHSNDKFYHKIELYIISGIDAYLVATVLIVFAIGLYELFIYRIDHRGKTAQHSQALSIGSLEQLKEKVSKLIVMILVVLYFKHALSTEYESTQDLLFLGLGIFFVSLALFFGHRGILQNGHTKLESKQSSSDPSQSGQ